MSESTAEAGQATEAEEAGSQQQQEDAAAQTKPEEKKEGDGDDDDDEKEEEKKKAGAAEAEEEDEGAAAATGAATAAAGTLVAAAAATPGASAGGAPASATAAAPAAAAATSQQTSATSAPLIPIILPPKFYDKPNEKRAGFIRLALDIRGVRQSGLLAVGPIRIPNPLASKSVNPGLTVEIKEKSVLINFASSSGELPYRYCIPDLVGRVVVDQSFHDTSKDLVKVYLRLHSEDLQIWAGIDRTKDYPLGTPDHVK